MLRPSVLSFPVRFLALAGSFPRLAWLYSAACAVAAFAYRWAGEPAPQLLYMYLVSIPVVVGTAINDSAREGRFDLLIARGCSRAAIWRTALIRSTLPAIATASIIAAVAGGDFAASPVAASLAIAAGNAMIGFVGGSVRPVAGFGFSWLVARGLFILIPAGASIYAHVIDVDGGAAPSVWKLFTAALFLPEFTLRKNVPGWVTLSFLAAGIVALAISFYRFETLELTGRRKR